MEQRSKEWFEARKARLTGSEAGEKDSDINGHKLTKVTRRGSISYSRAVKELMPDADLEAYRGEASEFWKLS